MDRKYVIGNFICELRREKGWTQRELGELMGVTNKAVSKWENGAALPRVEYLQRLAFVLGCTQEELFLGRRIPRAEQSEGAYSMEESYASVVQRCDCCDHEPKGRWYLALVSDRSIACKKCGAKLKMQLRSRVIQFLLMEAIFVPIHFFADELMDKLTSGLSARTLMPTVELARAHEIMLEYFPNVETCAKLTRLLIILLAVTACNAIYALVDLLLVKKHLYRYKITGYPHSDDGKIVF